MRPNVLFLTPRLPFPLVGGDRVKAFHLLKLLAARYQVTCVSFVEESPVPPEWLHAIRNLGVELHTVALHPAAAMLRVARTIFSSRPLEVQYYSHRRFRSVVLELAQRQSFDLVFAFFMRTAEYTFLLPNIPRILIAEDARVMVQERATQHVRVNAGYLMRRVERSKLRAYEPRIVDAFNMTTYVSERDREKILQLNPNARTAIITNGVDLNAFPFHGDQESRSGIVFAGKMDVHHNIGMAMHIGKKIFPALQKKFPELTCTIVGKNPPAVVRKLESRSLRVTGAVPHVGEYVARAAVFLHPQFFGAGIQNKVLETMALGTPVATTPVGISGIAAQDGVHALIATDTAGIVAACTRLLSSPALRTTIAHNARRLIETDHTWDVVGKQLDEVIARVNNSSSVAPTGIRMETIS